MNARRTRGRRVRRRTRFTPRRWLPFLVLVAVTAAVVVTGRQVTEEDDPAPTVELPARQLPLAAADGSLSSAWYCAAGTSAGDGGAAELVAAISNADAEGATAEVTAIDADGRTASTTVEVPARGRAAVTASDLLEAEWVGLVVEVLGGRAAVERLVTGPTGFDRTPCAATSAATWYVPSGSTLRGSSEHVVVFNPFPDDTSVDVSFVTDEGTREPRDLQGLTIGGRSLQVVPVAEFVSNTRQVATVVRARSGRIVVDRLQRHDGSGDLIGEGELATEAPRGLAATAGIATTADHWVFPDAEKSPGGRTMLVVYNPGDREARLDVTVAFERPERQPPVDPLALDVRAGEQAVLDLTDATEVPDLAPFSLDVRSIEGEPVVAELVRFGATAALEPTPDGAGDGGGAAEEGEGAGDGDAEEGAAGGEGEGTGEVPPGEGPEQPRPDPVDGLAVTTGSPVAATDWFVPTRAGGSTVSPQVVVHNPGAAPVTVEVVELGAGSLVALEDAAVEIPPGDRRNLVLRGAEARSGLLVSADGPIVVGRTVVAVAGAGSTTSLAMPFPEAVVPLPD